MLSRTPSPIANAIFSFLLISRCAATAEKPWPYNLPPHVKYYPEDEALVKRNLQVQQRMASEQPAVVRKMSGKADEMFFLDYWRFETDVEFDSGAQEEQEGDKVESYNNASMLHTYQTPFRPVDGSSSLLSLPLLPRNIFRRDFRCPSGTNSCSSIGRPNSCCATGDTCVQVQDTGLGDVGCCASGETCAGGVMSCDEDAGYSSCPNSKNGGCCIPNFVCADVGCVVANTETTFVANPPRTTTSPRATVDTATTTASTTTTVAPVFSKATPLSCSDGFQSCPRSLGGGCCPNDRKCGSLVCPASSTSTSIPSSSSTLAPPVRPTSGVATLTDTESPAATGVGACPTGFYMCSAYYRGACCRVGRDCSSTNCPEPATKTVVDNTYAGVTIMAPSGPSVVPTGNCADGWSTCPAAQGGGCCPGGYNCGQQSCTASGSGGDVVGKHSPSAASSVALVQVFGLSLALLLGVGMVVF